MHRHAHTYTIENATVRSTVARIGKENCAARKTHSSIKLDGCLSSGTDLSQVTGHRSLHPKRQLIVDGALRADASQPERRALASAQGHSEIRVAAAIPSPLCG